MFVMGSIVCTVHYKLKFSMLFVFISRFRHVTTRREVELFEPSRKTGKCLLNSAVCLTGRRNELVPVIIGVRDLPGSNPSRDFDCPDGGGSLCSAVPPRTFRNGILN